jgi:hypothetical protein
MPNDQEFTTQHQPEDVQADINPQKIEAAISPPEL